MKTITEQNKLPLCAELFDKANALQDNEYLRTSFGASDAFTIERRKDALTLKVWDAYHVCEYQPKKTMIIEKPADLVLWLVCHPEYYAENHFTKNLDFMNNWVNFLKAFKVYQYSETDKYIH